MNPTEAAATLRDRAQFEVEADLAVAAVLREMANIDRWCDMWSAAQALVRIRQIASAMTAERDQMSHLKAHLGRPNGADQERTR